MSSNTLNFSIRDTLFDEYNRVSGTGWLTLSNIFLNGQHYSTPIPLICESEINIIDENTKLDKKVNSNECFICFETEGDLYTNFDCPCNSVYHYNCINTWNKQNQNCPNCRSKSNLIKKIDKNGRSNSNYI